MNEVAPKLNRVYRLDNLRVDETYYTEEGFLIDHPIVTTVGIFEYINADGSVRKELRLPEEVFAAKSLESYEGKPIIITHDARVVTTENVEKEIIGTILSKAYQDGENVRAKIVIHNTDRMKESGLKELSLGYSLELDETPGEWNGQRYDAIQRNIEINHLALVSSARAGEQARLNIDGKENIGGTDMDENKVDGMDLSPEELAEAVAMYKASKSEPAATDGEATVVETTETEEPATVATEESDETILQGIKERRDSRKADAEGEKSEELVQADADIDALLAIIDKMNAEKDFSEAEANADGDGEPQPNNEDGEDCQNKDGSDDKSGSMNLDSNEFEKLLASKLEVVRIADKLHLDGVDKLTVFDGKKKIINSVYPNMRLDGKSDVYIDAVFDMTKQKLQEPKGTEGQRKQMFNADSAVSASAATSGASEARARMIEKQKNGGKK